MSTGRRVVGSTISLMMSCRNSSNWRLAGSATSPGFLDSDNRMQVARTAKYWGTTPSHLLGLPVGSLEAGLVDSALAVDLSDEECAADCDPDGDGDGDVVGSDWGVVPRALEQLPFEGG